MKKFLTLSFVMFLAVSPVFSITLEDLELQGPKLPAYRVGLTDKPENPYVEVKPNIEKKIEKTEVKAEGENINNEELTYADLSIKKMSMEISKELELEEEDMMALGRHISEKYGLTAENKSKYKRGLDLI